MNRKRKTDTELYKIKKKKSTTTNFSGKFFDLTITPCTNKYGYEKITNSLKFGNATPIDKYIDELIMIQYDDKTSDKNEKRTNRLIFLQECKQYESIKTFFTMMCQYLNGGHDVKDNKIIFTIVGGNIITIFAQLLMDILSNDGEPESDFNIKIIDKSIIAEVYNELVTSKTLEEQITNIYKHQYSDFDYNILPNIQKYNSLGSPKPNSGFLLYRIKTSMTQQNGNSSDTEIFVNGKDGKETCSAFMDSKTIDSLYAQAVKNNMLITLKDKEDFSPEKLELCRNFIIFLLNKKRRIEESTKINIFSVVNYLKDDVLKQSNNPYGNLNAIISYLNLMTTTINKNLVKYRNIKLEDFYSLESIESCNELTKACEEILYTVLVDENNNLYTNELFERIRLNITEIKGGTFTSQYSQIKNVSSYKSDALNYLKDKLTSNTSEYPKGSLITLNKIITDTAITTIDELDESMKELDEMFEQMTIAPDNSSGKKKQESKRKKTKRKKTKRKKTKRKRRKEKDEKKG